MRCISQPRKWDAARPRRSECAWAQSSCPPRATGFLLLLYYVIFVGFELLQFGLVADYSNDWRRDLSVAIVAPLMPFYYLYLRAASVVAVTEELFTRRSFRDTFVPERVRQATWHW